MMLKNSLFILMLLLSNLGIAQESKYILFDSDKLHQPTEVGPFQLYYNQVEIQSDTAANLSLHIYNLYFSRNQFTLYKTDQNAFFQAMSDYTKMENDLLIVMTPLYHSNTERKQIDITDKVHSGKISFISYPNLLQEAIRNLYRVSFPESNFCLNDSLIPKYGRTKRLDMKLVVKRDGRYYLANNYTLTEFYYISTGAVTFPNELTFGGINIPIYLSSSRNFPFSQSNFHKFSRNEPYGLASTQHYQKETYGRIYCNGVKKLDSSIKLFNYWMMPIAFQVQKFYKIMWPGDPFPIRTGINRFQFIERIGIVNGTYDFFFDKMFRTLKAGPASDSIECHFIIKSINQMKVFRFAQWYKRKYFTNEINFVE